MSIEERALAILDDALGRLRAAADEIAEMRLGLWTRMNSDAVPWSAWQDATGEFGPDFERVAAQVKAAEQILSAAFSKTEQEQK